VNRLTAVQRRAARILFELPDSAGFALAGGSALVALGVVDRLTRDLDAFIAAEPRNPPGDVRPLARSFTAALAAERWTVALVRDHVTFARLLATLDGETIEVDLAVDSPPLFPLQQVDGIPALTAEDLATRKVLAILDRTEGRDFTDLWALSTRLGRAECIAWAQQLDSGVSEHDVADAFMRLERLGDDELPCVPAKRAAVRTWFVDWTTELRRSMG
jgi:hypothetical protein